jgi:hypothetical protein
MATGLTKRSAHDAVGRVAQAIVLRKLKDIFRRFVSQPVNRVVELINPIVRGWVNYFAIGHASRCFGFVEYWLEGKVRRHLMRARNRRGFGCQRWSKLGSTTNSGCSTTTKFAVPA